MIQVIADDLTGACECAAICLRQVAAARAEGIDASGPLPPDTVFMLAFAGRFNAMVAA
jgi:4-hydroxy-L-threonine phosphate dehydrogenase PdxA